MYKTSLNLNQQSITQEHLVADDGEVITLPKYHFIFEPWPDPLDFDTYGGKKLLKYNNEPLFAELVVLRLLERQGYKGVWVDTYRNKFWQRLPHFAFPVLPDQKLLDVYERIYTIKGGRRSGCFDVMAYRDDHFIFVELKRQNEDSIRPSQIEWLKAAKVLRLEDSDFIIAEWTTHS
jgi:hypothetical protein